MTRQVTVFFFLTMFVSSLAGADMIQLRDGRTLEGEIIKRDNLHIAIRDERGRISQFYKDQVLNVIEGDLKTPILVDPEISGDIDQEKLQLILRLLEANGTRRNLEANIESIINKAPDERKAELKKLFDINEIVSEIVPVYDRHFTKEELGAIVIFYESEAGKKMIEVSSDLIKEVTQASLVYFQKKITSQ